MEQSLIPDLQLSYLLELYSELGSAADNFVLVGAQAMRFMLEKPRYTKDFDFVLDVISLRKMSPSIAEVLEKLQYKVVPEASRFQFVKVVPENNQQIRIEFLASDTETRAKNFRVDVQEKIHARACAGAEIVLNESDLKQIKGNLPNGKYTKVKLRIIRPHALLMMKLLAMDDRYKNIRGPAEAAHDRDEARIHSSDITAILHYYIQYPDFSNFSKSFWSQFGKDEGLKKRAKDIIAKYFTNLDGPGILLYAEFGKIQNLVVENEELNRVIREIGVLLQYLVTYENKRLGES